MGVLFVCTGNVCRSPMAERLLVARAPAGSPLRATSAGLAPLVGQPIDPPSAAALRALGADPAGHVAGPLTDELLQRADLVLTADAGQRAQVLGRAPRAMRHTFTMREFARLAGGLDWSGREEVSFADRVAAVAARRGQVAPPDGADDDIADPFRQSSAVARDCAQRILVVVETVLRVTGPATGAP